VSEGASRRPPLPHPRKRFAQHFLSDPTILGRIADALAPGPRETVVEIGPGRGALTERFAARAGRVVAIEVDRDLASMLRHRYASVPRVTIVEADALDVSWSELAGGDFLLAGNLPYNLTTPLLFKAVEPPLPRRAVFLVQREVAERIVAPEGGKEYGALSVNLRVVTDVEIVARVPAGAFQPRPSVDSSIIRLAPRRSTLIAPEEARAFREFVQSVFGMRRKQLQRILRSLGLDPAAAERTLVSAGVARSARPETLPVERFVALFRSYRREAGGGMADARATDDG
jgi:16S rRNA (adenine1518-N6/adenine1519-N6)-dimethyltransferase